MVDFKQLLERLRLVQTRLLGPELRKLISLREKNKILRFFLGKKTSSDQIKALQDISKLEPGKGYRLDKLCFDIDRSLTVLRMLNGKYQLLIETKRKKAGGTKKQKNEVKIYKGKSKKGKEAWRLDVEEAYINFVNVVDSPEIRAQELKAGKDSVKELRDRIYELAYELEVSKIMSECPNVTPLYLGPDFVTQNNVRKICLYSKKARTNLHDFLDTRADINLSPQQINGFITDLLDAVKFIHNKGYVHHDIKPTNVVVKDTLKGLKLELIDFGNASKIENKDSAVASMGHDSPEINYCYSKVGTEFYDYFNREDEKNRLGYQMYIQNPKLFPKTAEITDEIKFAHKANDMWALGVVIFELIYNESPIMGDLARIYKHPLLKGLLCPNRNDRFDIEQAIATHQEMMNSKQAYLERRMPPLMPAPSPKAIKG